MTIFAGYSQGVLGYVATPDEYPHGGYEPAVSHRGYGQPAPFSPEVAGIIERDRGRAARASCSRDRAGPRPRTARGHRGGTRPRRGLRSRLAGRRADLPLRYWRQQAHFTTPAADAAMARKAVEGGTAPVARMLERLGLTAADLADRLELPIGPRRGPACRPRRARRW